MKKLSEPLSEGAPIKFSASPYLTMPYKTPPPPGKKMIHSLPSSTFKIGQSSDKVVAQSSENQNDKRNSKDTSIKSLKTQSKTKNTLSVNSSIEKTKESIRTRRATPIGKTTTALNSTLNNDKYIAFKKIPSDIVLIILDYFGGIFKKPCLTEKDGRIDYHFFITKFYGRFTVDNTVKFLFRFIEGDHQAINNMRESIELMRLSFVGASKIRITGSISNYLLNCSSKADPSLAIRKLELFNSSLGNDCKKVTEVDFFGRETFSELCSLLFKSFTNLEVIRGGRQMMKRRENVYDTRFHAFDNSMAGALEEGGQNVREIKWLGSSLPKNLASVTPNLEIVHVECPQSIIANADLLCEWKMLTSISHIKHEVYTDYNPPPVNVTEYNKVFSAFSVMKNLQELTIVDDNRIPLDCFKLLENNQTLTKLNLDFCCIGNDFMKIIGTISNLKHFSAGSGSMTSQSLQNLLSLKQLQELRLDHCYRLTEMGCETLAKITTLRLLEFPNANMKDKGASMLVSLKSLRHLDLSCSLITNTAVETIVKGCKKLTFFNVTGCKYVFMDKFKEQVRKKIKKYH